MFSNLLEETKTAVLRYFPERQIYLRSGGEVSYYVLKTRTQLIATIGAAFVALWCLITLFNLIWGHNPLAGNSQQNRLIKAEYQRLLKDTEAKLENAEIQLNQQQADFAKFTRNLQDKHATIAQALNQPVLNTTFPEIDILGGVKKSALLRAPDIRDASSRVSRVANIKTSEVEIGAGVDRPLMNLDSTQNDILLEAENRTLDKIDVTRAIIEATDLNVHDVLRAGGMGTGGPLIGILSDGKDERVNIIQARFAESELLENALESVPLGFPVDATSRMTSAFGVRKDPFTKRPALHHAVDIGSGIGAPIVVTADGVVTHSGRKSGYGNAVIVDHGHGFTTKYAHMSKTLVKKGQKVKKGDNLGEMGNTGRSTGPHLHYEVLFQGRAYDPDKFIKAGLYVQ